MTSAPNGVTPRQKPKSQWMEKSTKVMNNEYPPPKKPRIFRIQRTSQYLRFKFWKFNIYLTAHPLSVRQGGLERTWRKKKRYRMKERILAERCFCQHCGKFLTWDEASIHHIIPRSVDPTKEFDPTNIQLLCKDCHARLHEIEQLEAKTKIYAHNRRLPIYNQDL